MREEEAREAAPVASLGRRDVDEALVRLSVVARRTKDASDGFVGHIVISGNPAKGFVVFNDTAHHVGPFFRWDTVLRLTWARILL